MSAASQVRATALLDLPAILVEAGIDPYGTMREAQIDPAMLERADHTIPAERVAWLLDGIAERNDLPDLGIRIAMRRRLANLGVAGLVLGQQATVREALAMVERYRHLMSDSLSLHIEEQADRALAMLGLAMPGSAPQRQSRELGLAAFVHLFRLMLGDRWCPDSVHFTHAAPKKPTQHRRFFGCPVQFDSPFDGFEFARDVLDRTRPGADPPKPGIAKAVAALAGRGISVRIISGDNRYVSERMATIIGIEPGEVLTGDKIAALDDTALAAKISAVSVFAEVEPQQKERIVRALQSAGHGPALHRRDRGAVRLSATGADPGRTASDVCRCLCVGHRICQAKASRQKRPILKSWQPSSPASAWSASRNRCKGWPGRRANRHRSVAGSNYAQLPPRPYGRWQSLSRRIRHRSRRY